MVIVPPSIDLGAVGPELILTGAASLLLLVGVFFKEQSRVLNPWIALAGVILAAGCASTSLFPHTTFQGMYAADLFTRFFKLLFLLGTGMTILISIKYTADEHIEHAEYYALLLFATVGMMLMAAASDLVTVFLGIELLSISLYILAGYTRVRLASNEASLKYFLLGGFATGFLLYGMALIYGSTGHTNLAKIAYAVSHGNLNTGLLTIGALLLLVGLGFKVAAAPFHQWTPDVYQGSPIPVTAFMSAGPKAAVLAVMIRLFEQSIAFMNVDWVVWITVLSILTMTVGNVAALVQTDAKRMLAFSSISHAGYAMVGMAAASHEGSSAVLYYMLVYTFMNIGAFGILALVARQNEQRTAMRDFTGFAYKNPALALIMTILVFSLAGIPPMAGFMAKFYIFMSAIKAGQNFLVLAAVLNSAIGIYYYLRFAIYMYMKEEEAPSTLPPLRASLGLILALVISLYGVIRLGILPAEYLDFAGKALLTF